MRLKIEITISLIICLAVFLWTDCGKSPSDTPPPLTGSMSITAQIDTMLVDSMAVILDNDSLGLHSNGCVITALEVGKHQVAVAKDDPASPIAFTSSPQLVAVTANETTDVNFALTKLAPNFTLKNLKNENVTLESFRGKVVLLVFYSHT